MIVAFLGTLLGSLAGGIVGWLWGLAGGRFLKTALGAIGGAMLGIGIQSWLHWADETVSGLWIGGLAGGIGGPAIFFSMAMLSELLTIERNDH